MPNESPSRAYRPLVLVLLGCCLLGVGSMVYTLEALRAEVTGQSQRFSDILWSTQMQTLTSTWVSGGVTYTVTTNRRDAEQETVEEFVQRHDAVVNAMKQLHPPD